MDMQIQVGRLKGTKNIQYTFVWSLRQRMVDSMRFFEATPFARSTAVVRGLFSQDGGAG